MSYDSFLDQEWHNSDKQEEYYEVMQQKVCDTIQEATEEELLYWCSQIPKLEGLSIEEVNETIENDFMAYEDLCSLVYDIIEKEQEDVY